MIVFSSKRSVEGRNQSTIGPVSQKLFFVLQLMPTWVARLMVAATASASSGSRLSGSRAPMWKPVTPSLT